MPCGGNSGGSHLSRWPLRAETAGKTDTYVSGVLVPEFLRIVDTGTGEAVWEEDGLCLAIRLLVPGGTGPGGSGLRRPHLAGGDGGEPGDRGKLGLHPAGRQPHPGVYLPAGGLVRWADDIHADITVGREDGKQPETFRCVFADPEGTLEGSSFLLTEEALPGTYDFDRDGTEETVYLQTLEGSDGFLRYQETGSQTIENGIEWTVALREGDETLWQREGFSTAHVGWGSLFACQVDGQDYLLSYTPYMGQGWLFFPVPALLPDGGR